jgi:hypothetical protein
MMRRSVLGCAVIVSVSCQSYTRVPTGLAEPPGSDIRLGLTSSGEIALVPAVGPHVTTLEGTVVSWDSSTIHMLVREIVRDNGETALWRDESVLVPKDAIATIETKQLSRVRSMLLAGALATGAGLIVQGKGGGATQTGVVSTPTRTK